MVYRLTSSPGRCIQLELQCGEETAAGAEPYLHVAFALIGGARAPGTG